MIKYPSPRRSDTVEDFHGNKVADPYDWLIDESDEREKWLDQECDLFNKFMEPHKATNE